MKTVTTPELIRTVKGLLTFSQTELTPELQKVLEMANETRNEIAEMKKQKPKKGTPEWKALQAEIKMEERALFEILNQAGLSLPYLDFVVRLTHKSRNK